MRRRTLLLALTALSLASTGGSCTAPAVRILAPAPQASLTWMPVRIVVDFSSAAEPGSLLVLLNGNDVTGAFAVEPTGNGRQRAVAEHVWGPGLVLPGANQLAASVVVGGFEHSAWHSFATSGDPYADALLAFSMGSDGGFQQGLLPGVVLGPPRGEGLFQGSLDVVSLGIGGAIELAFEDNVIVDGPGRDFTVFENAFLPIGASYITQPPFSEPGRVLVSQDGVAWHAFACAIEEEDAPYHAGCAGVYPGLSDGEPATPHASVPTDVPIQDLVGQDALLLAPPPGAGGDGFDLADVGLAWARYVRIEAADFTNTQTGPGKAAFDLDAVAAVHAAPADDADDNGIPDAVE